MVSDIKKQTPLDHSSRGLSQSNTVKPNKKELQEKLTKFYNQYGHDEKSVQSAVRDQLSSNAVINEEEISVVNRVSAELCGLVLLAPYFPILFKNLGYLDDEDKIFDDKIQAALSTLYYLAKGETSIPDTFDSTYGLLLLGISEHPANLPEHKLTKEEIDESDRLLSSIMSHWPASASLLLSGIREGILQRSGTFTDTGSNYQLNMNSHPLDVLLNTVPWSISVCFHPWMQKPLIVEWGI